MRLSDLHLDERAVLDDRPGYYLYDKKSEDLMDGPYSTVGALHKVYSSYGPSDKFIYIKIDKRGVRNRINHNGDDLGKL
jgi:hypothetical protein